MKYVIEMSEDEYKLFERDCINNGWRKTIEKAKPLQAELEEIKAEIDNIRDVEVTDGNIYVNEVNVFEILDKHINKADCDNDCEHCEWVECPKE